MPPMDVMKPNPGRVCSLQWNAARLGEPSTDRGVCFVNIIHDTMASGQTGAAGKHNRGASTSPCRLSIDHEFWFLFFPPLLYGL